MEKVYISNSYKETEEIASDFAKTLTGGEVIAFIGSLGMGKTCFTKGLVNGLGFLGEVNSPTFAIMNEYIGGKFPVYHFDMYRIEGWEDLDSCGFFDALDSGGVLAVEWSENVLGALPEDTIFISIERLDDNCRKITIKKGE